MAVGRIIVYAVGPTLDHSLWLLIVMAIVVLVEATLIMRPRFMGDYPIGFELGTMRNEASEGAAEVGVVDPVAAFAGLYGLSDVERDIVSLISQGRSRSFMLKRLITRKTPSGIIRGRCTVKSGCIPSKSCSTKLPTRENNISKRSP